MPDHKQIKENILKDEYGLMDKILYGGLGYGYFCIPSDFFKVIFMTLFPPLGILIHYFGKMDTSFPFISWSNIKNILSHMDEFIYSFILTMLFYVPGLVYTIRILFNKDPLTKNKDKFNNTKHDKNDDTNTDNDNGNDNGNDTGDDSDSDSDNGDDSDSDSDSDTGDDSDETINLQKLKETLLD
jgi:uncharacterized membrane protein YqaE (UPF0057 family)